MSFTSILRLLFSFTILVPAFAQSKESAFSEVATFFDQHIEKLPDNFSKLKNKGEGAAAQAISNAIFNQLENITAVNQDFGGTKFGLKLGRKIYDNFDIEESFTVVDRINVPVTLPGISIPLGSSPVSFNIGLSAGLELYNIRQVKAGQFDKAVQTLQNLFGKKDLEDRGQAISTSEWIGAARDSFKDSKNNFSTQNENPPDLVDSLNDARFGRLWNLVAFPLRLPLKADWLNRLDDNEVISYKVNGAIEVGPSVGITTSFLGQDNAPLNVGAHLRAYLRGQFKITVLKIDDRFTKVKVTRGHEKGISGSVGVNANLKLFDGILVATNIAGFKIDKTILKTEWSLVPFQVSGDMALGHSLEVGYLYDMKDERAVQAYEMAVLGQFGLSDELAEELSSQRESAPIQKLFQKNADSSRVSNNVQMKLKLYSKSAGGTYTVEDATIDFPDGTTKVYTANTVSNNERKLDFIVWHAKEVVEFNATVKHFNDITKKESTLGMIARGRIEDTVTRGQELNRYTKKFEELFSDKPLFPKAPIFFEDEYTDANGVVVKEAGFGRSALNYQIGFSRDNVIKLAQTPEDMMWPSLEIGFERLAGIWGSTFKRITAAVFGPLVNLFEFGADFGQTEERGGIKYQHALIFKDKWVELQQIASGNMKDPLIEKSFAEKLSDMFSDKTYTYELTKTVMSALRTQKVNDISYQVTIKSTAFPTIDIKSGDITEIEKITQAYTKATDFDKSPVVKDFELEVTGMKSEVIKINNKEYRVRVTFNLAKAPEMVVFRLDEQSSLLRISERLKQIVVYNRGQFKQGPNEIILDKNSSNDYEQALAELLEEDTNYALGVATILGKTSGPVSTTKFYTH